MKLREAREAAGWKERELARIVGVHVSHIRGLETGEHLPSRLVLSKIQSALPEVEMELAGPSPWMIRRNEKRRLKHKAIRRRTASPRRSDIP